MKMEVEWMSGKNTVWDATDCLFAYLHPKTDEILYIGKAEIKTVKERFDAPNQDDLFEYFKAILRLDSADLKIIIGEVWLDEGDRLTSELLAEIESLLIRRVQPPGNIQSKEKISRPGMVVKCTGEWPHKRKMFVDTDQS